VRGAELRRYRKDLGLTQVRLAKRLGVHPITLSRWERDESRIPKTAARLILLESRKAKG
jgi:transcriptional regulator with XRE-family HTH domain